MKSTWPLQDAKNRLSELIEHAIERGPQIISRRGRETAVVLSVEDFRRISTGPGDLASFLARSPLAEEPLDFSRRDDFGREIEF